jgi:hypothetical protein
LTWFSQSVLFLVHLPLSPAVVQLERIPVQHDELPGANGVDRLTPAVPLVSENIVHRPPAGVGPPARAYRGHQVVLPAALGPSNTMITPISMAHNTQTPTARE